LNGRMLDRRLPFKTLGELNRDLHLEQLVLILSVVTETCLPNRWLAMYSFVAIRCSGNVITEPSLSNRRLLWLHYSCFQALCHSIL
jgi:hypothetical protein